MDTEQFGQKLLDTIQQQILRGVASSQLIDHWGGLKPMKIPEDILSQAFASIDRDKILSLVRQGIEEQIAKTLLGQLLTETANDTKHLMSDKAFRDRLRQQVYPLILQELHQSP